MIYLASPYSHPSADVRHERFIAACRAAAALMREGHVVFSPIAHSYQIAVYGKLTDDWEFWERQSLSVLSLCDELVVLTLDGWKESVGVKAEIEHAIRHVIPIRFMEEVQ